MSQDESTPRTARRRKPKPHANHERWLVSYADFITLMFAFFVVMYATSKADTKKQAQMADSIDSAFRTLGIFPQNAGKLRRRLEPNQPLRPPSLPERN
jgi:chemotaxis protein MotB